MRLMTADELKAFLTAGILFAVALLATGCATIRASIAEQTHYQTMANQVTTAYRVPSIPVRLIDGFNGQYRCRDNQIDLGVGKSPGTLFLLGHELAHYVLGHGCAETLANEEAANSFAVRALVLWGYRPQDAATLAIRALSSAQRLQTHLPAHDWSAEIAALRAEYPEAR